MTTQPRAATFRAALRRTVREFREDDLTDWAATLTYYGVLSLFPAVIVLTSVLGLIGDSATAPLYDNLSRLAPGPARDLVTNTTRTSGPLRLADGRWITQSQSLLLHGDRAYSLCWVEVPNRDRSPRANAIRRLRRDTPEYRTRGYAEEMMLIRFAIR